MLARGRTKQERSTRAFRQLIFRVGCRCPHPHGQTHRREAPATAPLHTPRVAMSPRKKLHVPLDACLGARQRNGDTHEHGCSFSDQRGGSRWRESL